MDNIVIVGSSGHAKVIVDIVEHEGRYKIAGFLDRYRKVGEKILDYDVLGLEEDLPSLMKKHSLKGAVVAIGDNFIRSKVVTCIRNVCPDISFVSAIHPKASIAKGCLIGGGR